jgi:hypothetical protein
MRFTAQRLFTGRTTDVLSDQVLDIHDGRIVTVQFESRSGIVLANETDELQPLDPQGASTFSVSAPV